MFSSLSVYLFVYLFLCEQDISKSCERIPTKFGGELGYMTRTKKIYFGEDPNRDPDPGIFSDFSPLSDRAKMTRSRIYQKVADGCWGCNKEESIGFW